jgi:vesicle coat complex subunit
VSFYPQLDGQSSDALERLFQTTQLPTDVAPEEADLWFQEVAAAIARQGRWELLLDPARSQEPRKIRAAILGISLVEQDRLLPRREVVEEALLRFLGSPDPMVVAEAVDALRRLDFAGHLAKVETLLQHESPFVVGSALRYLAGLYPERALPHLLAALSSSEAIVRENAVDELDDLGWTEAVPQIRQLWNDPEPNVREAAQTAVAHLESLR